MLFLRQDTLGIAIKKRIKASLDFIAGTHPGDTPGNLLVQALAERFQQAMKNLRLGYLQHAAKPITC